MTGKIPSMRPNTFVAHSRLHSLAPPPQPRTQFDAEFYSLQVDFSIKAYILLIPKKNETYIFWYYSVLNIWFPKKKLQLFMYPIFQCKLFWKKSEIIAMKFKVYFFRHYAAELQEFKT